MQQVIITLDQSYTRTGWAVGVDGAIVERGSIDGCIDSDLKELDFTAYRNEIKSLVKKKIKKMRKKGFENIIIVLEAILPMRPLDFYKRTCALYGAIIDEARDTPVYSVSVSTWRKPDIKNYCSYNPKIHNPTQKTKIGTIMFVKEVLGFDCSKDSDGKVRKDEKGRILYNDDMSDAIAMNHFCFKPEVFKKLKREY